MQFSGLCRLYSSVSLLALATALVAAFPRNEAVHAEDATTPMVGSRAWKGPGGG
jgi:hypothetical protein